METLSPGHSKIIFEGFLHKTPPLDKLFVVSFVIMHAHWHWMLATGELVRHAVRMSTLKLRHCAEG